MTTTLLSSESFEISAKVKGKTIVPIPENGISTLAFVNDIPTVPTDLSAFTNSSGYVLSSSLVSTLADIDMSAFNQISSPAATVRSIQETLTQILNILKGQENN